MVGRGESWRLKDDFIDRNGATGDLLAMSDASPLGLEKMEMTVTDEAKNPPEGFGSWHFGETVDLTGRAWFNCMFRDCTLRLDSYDGSRPIVGCVLEECRLVGAGWAKTLLGSATMDAVRAHLR